MKVAVFLWDQGHTVKWLHGRRQEGSEAGLMRTEIDATKSDTTFVLRMELIIDNQKGAGQRSAAVSGRAPHCHPPCHERNEVQGGTRSHCAHQYGHTERCQ